MALEGEKTKPGRGHSLPTAPGRQGGLSRSGGVAGFVGPGLSLGGKAGGCAQIPWHMGAPWELRGDLSPGWSLPKERAWLRAGLGSCGGPATALLWMLDRPPFFSRPQFPRLCNGKAKPR